ncbi:DUF4232 domain-containing protein [Streptomyces sp. NPDC052036]|uniref:DUF4232 domain-containing protein n=1 Tax=Streptomyces sp. NPDC052036 TaxID=3155171 RepID=UPI003419D097
MSNLRTSRRTNLRLRKSAVALTGAAALLALLTACNGDGSSPKAASGNAAPAPGDSAGSASGDSAGTDSTGTGSTASGDAGRAPAKASTGSTDGGSAGTTRSRGGATGADAPAGGSAPACQADRLGYSWAGTKAAPSGGGDQMQAVVALTNKGGHACSLHGFPGVDLVNSGQQWSLQRDNTTPRTVTLAYGASAHFTLTYLVSRSADSTAFRPTTVVITAPNERSSYDLPWRFGALVKQDGATHPGTFIGPVGK